MIRLDPLTTEAGREAALENAIDLGLDECVGCPGCKCGVGINLKGLVVKALVDVAGDRLPSAAERARTRALTAHRLHRIRCGLLVSIFRCFETVQQG